MKYLLDTSVFLWALAAVEKLNPKAQELLSNTREELFLSAASAWEISIKCAIGRLQLPQPPVQCVPMWLREWGIRPLEVTHSMLSRSATCPCITRAPSTACSSPKLGWNGWY